MKPNYKLPSRSAGRVTGLLILCLFLLFSRKSTASTIAPVVTALPDSLPQRVVLPVEPLESKPIRLTEAGARQVLKDRADLVYYRSISSAKDTLLNQQRTVISEQSATISRLNGSRQGVQNQAAVQQQQLETTRRKLRAARLENWLVRGAVALYVGLKVYSIVTIGR